MHRFVNRLERPIGTYLYGRRMYEVMRFWQGEEAMEGRPDHVREYAEIWRGAQKVVFSRTLDEAETPKTLIERDFDPDAVRRIKEEAERDISVGGATLAGEALQAGLVDEVVLILAPVLVGGGTRALPEGFRLDLELVAEGRFQNGFVHLRYEIA